MSETEVEPAPEQLEQLEEQPAVPETTEGEEKNVESPQPESPEAAESKLEEVQEPVATSEERPAEDEGPEVEKTQEPEKDEKAEEDKTGEDEAGENDKPEEGADEKAKPEPEPKPKPEPEPEEPVVITPEGSPHWLSTEDILSKGLPESEVENFRNFYFKQVHSLQHHFEQLKNVALQTEFITLSKEEIEALSVQGDLTEGQQQVLNGLQDRINSAIELYEGDGALVRINDRSAKDSILDKNEENFIQTIRDSVINALEVEKQSFCAYSIWKDQEYHPGAFKRGMNKLRASLRRSRSRANSADAKKKHKLEENVKAGKKEAEEEPKPVEDGAVPPKCEDEEKSAEVTVQVEIENAADEGKAEESANKSEEPKEEAKEVKEAPKEETPAEGEAGEKKEVTPVKDDKQDGEIQVAENEDKKESEDTKNEEEKSKSKPARKKKLEEHQHKAAKTEPLDNQILRAFGRVTGALYRVQDGKAALEQLRSSVQIRNDLNKLKAFGGVEGVQVSLSVCRWLEYIPDNAGMIFRGFVYNNELNGLSQYNNSIYFPNVVHYKDTIITGKVIDFFQENIKEQLKELNNYIIDFFVAPEKIYVYRLSPFYTSVGACLFTWNEDGRVLTKGPFEFRTVDTPKTAPEAFTCYQIFWQDMLNSVLQQRKSVSRGGTSSAKCVLL